MPMLANHPHSFLPEAWPFAVPDNSASFTTDRLWSQQLPILQVFHCQDGDWQFFNGDIADDDECLMVCLGCVYERDASIAELASLAPGWSASRNAMGERWHCEPFEEEEDDE